MQSTFYTSNPALAVFNKEEAEQLFKTHVNPNGEMLFTYVPRGLIISIDENVFFNDNNDKIKPDCLYILNSIGEVLNHLDQPCVVEGHTETINQNISRYKTNWELSLARANNITKYLMRYAKVSPERISALGFGEFMPFSDNVSKKGEMNNRIDFVIMYYEAKR